METRENQVVRMRPRPNENVNAFFMCDWGRLNYRWMNEKKRIERPMVRRPGSLSPTTWEEAITAAARALSGKRVFVAASPMLSNESLYLLTQVMQGGGGAFRVTEGEEAPLPGVKDLALRRERAANVKGAETLGFRKTKDLLGELKQGDVLVIAGEDLEGVDASALTRASDIIVIGSVLPEIAGNASVVLPIANFSEEEGTVTNLRGRVQRFTQARQAPGETRPSWLVLGDLLGAMGKQSSFFLPSEVFAKLASSTKAFAGLSYDTIGFKGLPLATAPASGPAAPVAMGAA
jgi:NADH-quinone oxidoreductase subunit G